MFHRNVSTNAIQLLSAAHPNLLKLTAVHDVGRRTKSENLDGIRVKQLSINDKQPYRRGKRRRQC
jgi:hypothetical protein